MALDSQPIESKSAPGKPPGKPGAAPGQPTPAMGQTPEAGSTLQTNPWAGLLQVGLSVLQELAAQTGAAAGGANGVTPSPRPTAGSSLLHRDDRTGEPYMKIPMPSPEVLDQALGAIASLLEHLRGPKA